MKSGIPCPWSWLTRTIIWKILALNLIIWDHSFIIPDQGLEYGKIILFCAPLAVFWSYTFFLCWPLFQQSLIYCIIFVDSNDEFIKLYRNKMNILCIYSSMSLPPWPDAIIRLLHLRVTVTYIPLGVVTGMAWCSSHHIYHLVL